MNTDRVLSDGWELKRIDPREKIDAIAYGQEKEDWIQVKSMPAQVHDIYMTMVSLMRNTGLAGVKMYCGSESMTGCTAVISAVKTKRQAQAFCLKGLIPMRIFI